MDNRDPIQPDPLRDEKNWDAASGLVAFHQLQRMWDESREETVESDADRPLLNEVADVTPPIVSGTGNRAVGGTLITIGVLVLVVLLLFMML